MDTHGTQINNDFIQTRSAIFSGLWTSQMTFKVRKTQLPDEIDAGV
jgi:hypothetical protein